MLRQSELWRVLGRRLTERLLRAGRIEPVRENGGIYFDTRVVHRALSRVQNEGIRLNGNVYGRSVRPARKAKRTGAEILIELDEL